MNIFSLFTSRPNAPEADKDPLNGKHAPDIGIPIIEEKDLAKFIDSKLLSKHSPYILVDNQTGEEHIFTSLYTEPKEEYIIHRASGESVYVESYDYIDITDPTNIRVYKKEDVEKNFKRKNTLDSTIYHKNSEELSEFIASYISRIPSTERDSLDSVQREHQFIQVEKNIIFVNKKGIQFAKIGDYLNVDDPKNPYVVEKSKFNEQYVTHMQFENLEKFISDQLTKDNIDFSIGIFENADFNKEGRKPTKEEVISILMEKLTPEDLTRFDKAIADGEFDYLLNNYRKIVNDNNAYIELNERGFHIYCSKHAGKSFFTGVISDLSIKCSTSIPYNFTRITRNSSGKDVPEYSSNMDSFKEHLYALTDGAVLYNLHEYCYLKKIKLDKQFGGQTNDN